MNTEADFVAAIRAQPSDDALRLVYADFLQELGDDLRAELIRVQVEIARPLPAQPATMSYSLVSSDAHVQQVLDFRAATARRAELERRERALLGEVRVPLPPGWALGVGMGLSVRAPRGDLFVRRGLGERAVCSGPVWIADANAILALHPVERVRLTSVPSLQTEFDGVELLVDASQPIVECELYRWADVRAARRDGDPPWDGLGLLSAVLRLRFGESVFFDLSGLR